MERLEKTKAWEYHSETLDHPRHRRVWRSGKEGLVTDSDLVAGPDVPSNPVFLGGEPCLQSPESPPMLAHLLFPRNKLGAALLITHLPFA